MDNVAVIMAGGVGSRLFPLSSEEKPKQFLSLLSDKPMIQESIDRVKPIFDPDLIFINSIEKYRGFIENEPYEAILEPHRAGTTASVLFITLSMMHKFGDCVITLLPSDHYVGHGGKYREKLKEAQKRAKYSSDVILLGVMPTDIDTGYGYVRNEHGIGADFREKPTEDTARRLIDSGYLWNSGIFVFRASVMFNLFKQNLDTFACYFYAFNRDILEPFYRNIEINPKSFEKAIIEKANNLSVLSADFDWSDIGDWNRYQELKDRGVIKDAEKDEIDERIDIGG